MRTSRIFYWGILPILNCAPFIPATAAIMCDICKLECQCIVESCQNESTVCSSEMQYNALERCTSALPSGEIFNMGRNFVDAYGDLLISMDPANNDILQICTTIGVCDSGSSSSCAANYYGTSATGCSPCPNNGKSPAGSTAVTSCYITSGNDNTGAFDFNGTKCYYQ